MTDADWLRAILGDQPSRETEAVTGDGVSREFTVANPPIGAGTLVVTLQGVSQVAGVEYIQPDAATVRFATAPPANAHVVLAYQRVTFADAELDSYLLTAAEHWHPVTQRLGYVYFAATLALDSLTTGAATALSFGASPDASADFTSVFDRLSRLRAALAGQVASEARRPIVFDPPPEPAP